jgi:hypothetical protein
MYEYVRKEMGKIMDGEEREDEDKEEKLKVCFH